MNSLPKTEKDAITLLQQYGILPRERHCVCDRPFVLQVSSSRARWRCAPCAVDTGLRVGTWFEGTRLSFTTAVAFIYAWAMELTSKRWCQTELGMSPTAMKAWSATLREICLHDLTQRVQQRIGGPGTIVEIDESVFAKRKTRAASSRNNGSLEVSVAKPQHVSSSLFLTAARLP